MECDFFSLLLNGVQYVGHSTCQVPSLHPLSPVMTFREMSVEL